MTKQDIEDELQYIELNYEFNDECPVDQRNYMLRAGLVKYYEDTLMLTPQGELMTGVSKAELRDKYGDEDGDEESSEVYRSVYTGEEDEQE